MTNINTNGGLPPVTDLVQSNNNTISYHLDTVSNKAYSEDKINIQKGGEPASTPFDFKEIPAAKNVGQSKAFLEARRDAVINSWAEAPMEEWQGWVKKGKFKSDPSGPPKVKIHNRVNAKLTAGIDVENANRVIMDGKPYSGVGTQFQIFGPIQRKGDYDFALRGMTALAYQQWDNPALKPETREHLAKVLLNQEGSEHIKKKWLFGLIPETENHQLMTESSRYLKNQLVEKYGMTYSTHKLAPKEYNNELNGFNHWFIDHLSDFARNDFDEYNSRPYQGYTTKAIQNLYEFADDPKVKTSAQILLDYSAARFATQSSDLRRVVPFRRRQGYQDHDNVMEKDSEAARYAVLAGNYNAYKNNPEGKTSLGTHNMLLPAIGNYRVPDAILDLMIDKGNNPYFMKVHHENTEIVYAEENFTISAGGHYHDWSNMPFSKQENGIPMPTVLMLKNAGPSLSNMIRFLGRGDSDKINNTGVYENFAFGIRPTLPDNLLEDSRRSGNLIEKGNWKFMEVDNVYIAMNTQSKPSPDNYASSVGFMEVVDKKEFSSLKDFSERVQELNPSKFKYYGDNTYTSSRGKTITFEMAEAPEKNIFGKFKPPKTKEIDKWPVKEVREGNQKIKIEREFEKWNLADSYTMHPENDNNNDYVIKADGTGQILINNPKTDKSLMMSLADHENPVRIEQNGEIINLAETAAISKDYWPGTLQFTANLKDAEKLNYLSIKWEKGSKPENIQVYIKESGKDQWIKAEQRFNLFNSSEYDFRTDLVLENQNKIESIKFIVSGKDLDKSSGLEIYKAW